jgi:hypothetical protein
LTADTFEPVSQPSRDDLVQIAKRIVASRTVEEVLAVLRESRETAQPDPAVLELLRSYLHVSDAPLVIAEERTLTAGAALRAESRLTAEASVAGRFQGQAVTKPALPEWFNKLPCGQQLGVVVILLLVALSLPLPPDDRDYVAYLLAVLGAAIWAIQRITKS